MGLLGIGMLMLALWALYVQASNGKLPAAVNLASAVAAALASAWFVRHVTRGGKWAVVPISTVGGERLKKSTRLLLEVLCGQMIGSLGGWFLFYRTSSMPVGFQIGMLIFGNVMLFVWFLQGRSADKESFNPKVW